MARRFAAGLTAGYTADPQLASLLEKVALLRRTYRKNHEKV
jgi:hypothetical protein